MDDHRLIEAYWAAVEQCLTDLFQCSMEDVRGLTGPRREQLDRDEPGRFHLGYHQGPFAMAFTLAHPEMSRIQRNREADAWLSAHEAEVAAIVQRHFGDRAEALGRAR